MCNLSGYIGKEANVNTLKLLMIFGRERGKHGCGFAYNDVHSRSTTYIEKDSIDFVLNNEFPIIDGDSHRIIMHNRQASSGSQLVKNAHPFKYDDNGRVMYFMHNGTINNTTALAKQFNLDFKDFDVDSQLLGQIIYNADNDFKVIGDMLRSYEGGAALVWYYEDENTVNVWKGASINHKGKEKEERPLDLIYLDQGIYFASKWEHLAAIANHLNHKIYTFIPNQIYTLSTDSTHMRARKINRQVKEYVSVTYYKNYTRGSSTVTKYEQERNPSKMASFDEIYYYNGKYYVKKENTDVLVHGGVWVNDDNIITENTNDERLWFYRGYWMKNEEAYSRILARTNQIKPPYHDVHKESIYLVGQKYYNGRNCINQWITDKRFAFYDYKTDVNAYLEKDRLTRQVFRGLFNITGDEIDETEQLQVENYNKGMAGWQVKSDCKTLDECEEHFAQTMGVESYLNLQATYNELITGFWDNDHLNLHSDVDQFNRTHGTSFITKRACNDYYYEKNHAPYNNAWPLTESKFVNYEQCQ